LVELSGKLRKRAWPIKSADRTRSFRKKACPRGRHGGSTDEVRVRSGAPFCAAILLRWPHYSAVMQVFPGKLSHPLYW